MARSAAADVGALHTDVDRDGPKSTQAVQTHSAEIDEVDIGDVRPGVPLPKRADARRNYERLIVAAREAVAERGADASLEDIAKRAGVGIGTLYRHFPSRQELLEAVYRDGISDLCERGAEILRRDGPDVAFAEWLRALARHGTEKRGLAAAMNNSLDGEVVSWCRASMMRTGGALLAAAQQSGAIRTDVDLSDLFKTVHGLVLATESLPDREERVDRMIGILLDGLRVTGR